MISFDDFSKLNMVIGTIVDVEEVPETDRLLKLTVDVGESETRQIVSGIRHLLSDPKSMVGRQVPFLINLEPRVIKGIESQGMILATETEEGLVLLSPDQEVSPGTVVR